MEVCAGIVTYQPDLSKLQRNLDHILDQVDKVWICDNGSDNLAQIMDMTANISKAAVFPLYENKGIAAALNQLCRLARHEGCQWILTLDQDSACEPDLVAALYAAASDERAICAPQIVYRDNESFCTPMEQPVQEVEWVITSASLTNLDVWNKIGGFDERMFIDQVDYDYCLRASRAGYSIVKVRDAVLYHELGALKCRKVLHKTIYVTNHSPFRRYYMSRNAFYIARKLEARNPYEYVAKNALKVLFFEDQKVSKLKAIAKGCQDGWHMPVLPESSIPE